MPQISQHFEVFPAGACKFGLKNVNFSEAKYVYGHQIGLNVDIPRNLDMCCTCSIYTHIGGFEGAMHALLYYRSTTYASFIAKFHGF